MPNRVPVCSQVFHFPGSRSVIDRGELEVFISDFSPLGKGRESLLINEHYTEP